MNDELRKAIEKVILKEKYKPARGTSRTKHHYRCLKKGKLVNSR